MRKYFRVYLPFSLNSGKRMISYKFSVYIWVLCSILGTFINYYLWMAIYRNSSTGILGGLSRNEMITYIFMSYIASGIAMIDISEWINEDVVEGNVAMNLIKPINYRTRLIFEAFGEMLFHFFASAALIWVGVELYRVFGLGLSVTPVQNMLLFLLSAVMSFFIYVMFEFCFGMIAFFTTYIFGLQMVKAALLSFLTGQLIPLSFFPEVLQRVFDFLPFSSMVYAPVMIYLGKYSTGELLFVLGRQFVWILLLYLLGSLIWRKVTKRLVVLGG